MIAGAVTAQQILGTAGPGFVPQPGPYLLGAEVVHLFQNRRACRHTAFAIALEAASTPLLHDQRAACHDRAARFVVMGVPAPQPRAGRVMTR